MRTHNLHIVSDENIPFVDEYFGRFGAICTVPAAQIDRHLVKGADALLVRSVTSVGRSLLEGTAVRFVGSATAGCDHVDTSYLHGNGIRFAHAPGSNAGSVVEYVLAAAYLLGARTAQKISGKTVGVVGCGQIGERVAERLERVGCNVLRNDPPRAERNERTDFVSLNRVLDEAEIITLHTPLERSGVHPTFHLIDEAALRRMRPDVWLINTSRGAVVESQALLAALRAGRLDAVVLDVWESEPEISKDLLAAVAIGTPHIAGYSLDAKVRGTEMIADALAEWLGQRPSEAPMRPTFSIGVQPPDPGLPDDEALHFCIRQMYDVGQDDARMRRAIHDAELTGTVFRLLRKNYPERRSFDRYGIPDGTTSDAVGSLLADVIGMHRLPLGYPLEGKGR